MSKDDEQDLAKRLYTHVDRLAGLAISWRSAVGLNSAAPDFLNDIRFAYRF